MAETSDTKVARRVSLLARRAETRVRSWGLRRKGMWYEPPGMAGGLWEKSVAA
jgi:hypothetical protein